MPAGEIKFLSFSDGVVMSAPPDVPLAAGGGGGSAAWNAPEGQGAMLDEQSGEKVYLFPDAADEKLVLFLKVPSSYQTGNPIAMQVGYYADSTTLTVKFLSTAYLVRKDTDAIDTTTNSRASTNVAVTNAAPTKKLRSQTLDLTATDGTINSVAVTANDMIRVELTRDYANDTDTGIAYFVPGSTEVAFQ